MEISGGKKKNMQPQTDFQRRLVPSAISKKTKKQKSEHQNIHNEACFVSSRPDFKRDVIRFPLWATRVHFKTACIHVNDTNKRNNKWKSCQHAGRNMDLFPLKTQILKKEHRAYLYPKTYKYDTTDLDRLDKQTKKRNATLKNIRS